MRRVLREPSPGRLVLALTWNQTLTEKAVLDLVERFWGPIGLRVPAFNFHHTNYYAAEMGETLTKGFVEILGEIPREQLVGEKLKAWKLEEEFMTATGQRNLNIDPMIVTPENVIISTSKNFVHRVYLGREVYGDMAFLFRNGHYEPMAWTYPDYKEHVGFLENVRARR